MVGLFALAEETNASTSSIATGLCAFGIFGCTASIAACAIAGYVPEEATPVEVSGQVFDV